MAAGGWKIFTAGDVLTAADTMDYLQQGVLVFNNSGARGSAIAAPAEGQFSYLKDTDVTEYYDGSTWTPVAQGGLAPATPTSIANSGGSASLTGNTVTFSGVSSVSLNGCFTGDYDNYAVFVSGTAGGSSLQFRLRSGGSDNSTASSYVYQDLFASSTTVTAARTTDTNWIIGTFGGSANNFTVVEISNPFVAASTGFFARNLNDSSFARIMFRGGTHNASSSFDGFTIYGGTFNGSLSVFGYRK